MRRATGLCPHISLHSISLERVYCSCVAGSTFVLLDCPFFLSMMCLVVPRHILVLLLPKHTLGPVMHILGGTQTLLGTAQTHFRSCYAHFEWCPNTSWCCPNTLSILLCSFWACNGHDEHNKPRNVHNIWHGSKVCFCKRWIRARSDKENKENAVLLYCLHI